MSDKYMTVKNAAAYLDCSVQNIYNLIERNVLEKWHKKGTIYVLRSEVVKYNSFKKVTGGDK